MCLWYRGRERKRSRSSGDLAGRTLRCFPAAVSPACEGDGGEAALPQPGSRPSPAEHEPPRALRPGRLCVPARPAVLGTCGTGPVALSPGQETCREDAELLGGERECILMYRASMDF